MTGVAWNTDFALVHLFYDFILSPLSLMLFFIILSAFAMHLTLRLKYDNIQRQKAIFIQGAQSLYPNFSWKTDECWPSGDCS